MRKFVVFVYYSKNTKYISNYQMPFSFMKMDKNINDFYVFHYTSHFWGRSHAQAVIGAGWLTQATCKHNIALQVAIFPLYEGWILNLQNLKGGVVYPRSLYAQNRIASSSASPCL